MTLPSTIASMMQIAYYLIMGYGVYVCWQAFRAGRQKAWLLIGAFVLSAFLGPVSGAARTLLFRSEQVETQYEHLTDGRDGPIPVKTVSLKLPIFPLMLVVGLSFLAEGEIKRSKAEHPSSPDR